MATDAVALQETTGGGAITIGVDGIDCITAYDADEAPLQICEDSSDPWNDLDEISLPSNDRAVLPSRDDHVFSAFRLPPSAFSLSRQLSFVLLGQPERSPYNFCLCEHLRERAPPSLV